MKVTKDLAFPKPIEGRPLAEIITNLLKETPLTVPHLARRPEFQKTGQARHDHIAVFMHVVRQYRLTGQGKMRFRESNGVWQCSYSKLAQDLSISKPRARRIVKELHEGGLIEIRQCTLFTGGNPIPYVTFLAPVVPALKILGQEWAGSGMQVYWSGRPLENRKTKMDVVRGNPEKLFSWDENLWGVWTMLSTGVVQGAGEVCSKTAYPYTVKALQTLELQSGSGPTFSGSPDFKKPVELDLGLQGAGRSTSAEWEAFFAEEERLVAEEAGVGVTQQTQATQDPVVPAEAETPQAGTDTPGWAYLCHHLKRDYMETLLREGPHREFLKKLPVATLERTLKTARSKASPTRKFLTVAKMELDTLIPPSHRVTTSETTHPTHAVVHIPPPAVSATEKARVDELIEQFQRTKNSSKANQNPFRVALESLGICEPPTAPAKLTENLRS